MEIDKEVSAHEQLHLRPVSCVTVSGDGETIVTGSPDRSVRIWRFCKHSGSRTLEHLATLCGHDGSIVCLDICTAYSIVVSGSEDRTAMVWDSRGAKLLRVLDNHSGTVLSVSVNAISGNIATLTAGELRLYSINGELLSRATMHGDGQQVKHKARVVLCPPSGSWQDGIVAVTGHENGHVFLWKLKISISEDEEGHRRVVRELVSFSLTKVHRADITVLRLCPSATSKSPHVITRVFNGDCAYELVVGDADGAGSRWAPGKLEQLSPSELQQTLNHPNTTPSRLGISATL
jgi:WD40 repeat protein